MITTGRRRVALASLNPIEQLRAGRLVRRIVQLNVGLVLFGISMALLVRAGLGLEPWGVLHYGIIQHVPLTYGIVSIVVAFAVLLLWIPLRQWPGLGTVLNAIVIGVAIDVTLGLLGPVDALPARIGLLVLAILGNGLAGALYIGSQLGPGPRDGLMTGLSRRTGRSIRLVRTLIELTVVAVGWALGGVVGIGTILYAVCIGPILQLLLPYVTVDLPGIAVASDPTAEGD